MEFVLFLLRNKRLKLGYEYTHIVPAFDGRSLRTKKDIFEVQFGFIDYIGHFRKDPLRFFRPVRVDLTTDTDYK